MKLLSGILGLTLTSAVALASANAADMYRAPAGGGFKDGPYIPVASWTGFYIGVNGGYGWANEDNYAVVLPEGGFGGGQIGYNWQGVLNPSLVIGIEADIQGADISDSIGVEKQSLNYFGTVRGRLGYAFERTLVYATGGFAYGEVEYKNPVFSLTDTQTGWVVGGGIEYKLTPAWSLKGEYQFLSLDAKDSDPGSLTWGDSDRSEIHTVRVGLNYHVGHGYEPLK
jgi:outer membrane immunogenic protein